ncbi:MAG: hypothetical protein VB054_04820 [Petrimonas sp.]|mgnify:CR=1 FL=1|jgi:hypothetical protein|nr:hypothetical protein [Petrimonas sp.]
MTKVRAKFECHYIQPANGYVTVHLHAVYSNKNGEKNKENESFAKATPGGSLIITIDDDTEASNLFEQGSQYYLDFVKSE